LTFMCQMLTDESLNIENDRLLQLFRAIMLLSLPNEKKSSMLSLGG
jgi:hypothetical protein